MKTFLNIVRWFLAVILMIVFLSHLFVGAFIISSVKTTLNQHHLKGTIKASGIYDNSEEIVFDGIAYGSGDNEEAEAGFTEIKDNLKNNIPEFYNKIFNSDFLETEVNESIDTAFAWAKGETTTIDIEITLADDNEDLITMLSTMFTARVEGLEPCQDDFVRPEKSDPFSLECRPADFDASEITAFLTDNQEMPELQEFLNQASYKPELDQINESVTSWVQLGYFLAQLIWVWILIIALLLGIIIVLLIPGFKRGLIVTGSLILFISLVIILIRLITGSVDNWLINYGFNQIPDDFPLSINSALNSSAEYVWGVFKYYLSIYSLVLFIVSLGMILLGAFLPKKNKEIKQEEKPEKK